MDAQTKRAIDQLTQELLRTQAELATVKRASRRPQLGHSSIESGSLDVVDPETGSVRLRLGYQPDGTVGVVPEGGDPPPAPSTPVVAAAPVGLMVQWDGALADPELILPGDFDHVSVHVSPTSGFTPTAATFQGTIPRAGGLFPVVPLEVGETYYVLLVPVGTGGVEGAPSAEASGVPEGVGGVPEPGSITEVEIADDAISTPKLQALAVNAAKIAANAIEAGHIQAGAVEASKLAAEIVLASRIIAGNPSADRVEIDGDGLRGYDGEGALVFAVQGGNAVFSGDITGSEISGSRISLTSTGGTQGVIEEVPGGLVRARMDSASGARAQLQGSPGQAEFSVWGDAGDPNGPAGGVLAQPGVAALTLYSDVSQPGVEPSVSISALPGQANGRWVGADGSEVRIRALDNWSSIDALPTASTVGQPNATAGFVYAFRRTGSDAPTLSLQSPLSVSGPGAGRRSIIHVEGANTNRAHTIINHAARVHYLQGELVDGSTDTTTDGVVQLAPTHSLLAPRHAPMRTDMNSGPDFSTIIDFVDFTTAQYPPIDFRTSWSGQVRITITAAARNTASDVSAIQVGFRLSGGSTVPAAVSRSWSAQSKGAGTTSTEHYSRTLYMSLNGNANYTLTPAWRISGGSSSSASFHMSYEQSIVVEPLM